MILQLCWHIELKQHHEHQVNVSLLYKPLDRLKQTSFVEVWAQKEQEYSKWHPVLYSACNLWLLFNLLIMLPYPPLSELLEQAFSSRLVCAI